MDYPVVVIAGVFFGISILGLPLVIAIVLSPLLLVLQVLGLRRPLFLWIDGYMTGEIHNHLSKKEVDNLFRGIRTKDDASEADIQSLIDKAKAIASELDVPCKLERLFSCCSDTQPPYASIRGRSVPKWLLEFQDRTYTLFPGVDNDEFEFNFRGQDFFILKAQLKGSAQPNYELRINALSVAKVHRRKQIDQDDHVTFEVDAFIGGDWSLLLDELLRRFEEHRDTEESAKILERKQQEKEDKKQKFGIG